VRTLAAAMNDCHARFITSRHISCPASRAFAWNTTGTQRQGAGFPFQLSGNSIESIFDLCEAVDWIERETHEGFAVDFMGREYEPLLRQGDTPGVNLREEPKSELQIPMGISPALEEPYKLDLICEGETVSDAKLHIGSTSAHRASRRIPQLHSGDRADGARLRNLLEHPHAHPLPAMEQLTGQAPPPRAQYIRVVVAELERLHFHVLWRGSRPSSWASNHVHDLL